MRSARLSGGREGMRSNYSNRNWIVAAAVAGLSIHSSHASAGSTWIGSGSLATPGSGNWNAAGSWSPNGVPSSSTTTELDFTDGSSSAYAATNNIGAVHAE